MVCAHCGQDFRAKHPAQRFCSPVRGQRLCKDAHHNQRRRPVIVNGVEAPAGFVGLSDDEHEACMDLATSDDF